MTANARRTDYDVRQPIRLDEGLVRTLWFLLLVILYFVIDFIMKG